LLAVRQTIRTLGRMHASVFRPAQADLLVVGTHPWWISATPSNSEFVAYPIFLN
jgi:hypothetical protein